MTAALHMQGAESLRHRALPPRSRSRRDVTPPLPSPHRPAPTTRDDSAPSPARCRAETRDKTFVCSKMADGSLEDRAGPKQMNDLTFSAPNTGHGDIKKCSGETFKGDRVKLSFYTELNTSESREKSESNGVAAHRTAAADIAGSLKSCEKVAEGEDRKKRCFDRYDSSESSDRYIFVVFC